jgi:hypothetical protein
MAVEGNGAAVDQDIGISLGNHTVIMPGHRTGASVAYACNSAPHDDRLRFTRFHRSAVRRRIADAYDTAHVFPPLLNNLPANPRCCASLRTRPPADHISYRSGGPTMANNRARRAPWTSPYQDRLAPLGREA